VLTSDKSAADAVEGAVKAGANAEFAKNLVTGPGFRWRKSSEGQPDSAPTRASRFLWTPKQEAAVISGLYRFVQSGQITGTAGRQYYARILSEGPGTDVDAFVRRQGLQISDEEELAGVVDEVIGEHADAVESFRAGKENALKFLVGQVMRKTRGRANPQVVNELLRDAADRAIRYIDGLDSRSVAQCSKLTLNGNSTVKRVKPGSSKKMLYYLFHTFVNGKWLRYLKHGYLPPAGTKYWELLSEDDLRFAFLDFEFCIT